MGADATTSPGTIRGIIDPESTTVLRHPKASGIIDIAIMATQPTIVVMANVLVIMPSVDNAEAMARGPVGRRSHRFGVEIIWCLELRRSGLASSRLRWHCHPARCQALRR